MAGGDIIFPTASSPNLGRGRYQIGPGIAVSVPVSELNSVVFPTFQHITSVGGDPSRNDVNYTRVRTSLYTPWFNNQWWTSFKPNLFIDWNQKSRTAMNLEFEMGKRLGAQVGIRYIF